MEDGPSAWVLASRTGDTMTAWVGLGAAQPPSQALGERASGFLPLLSASLSAFQNNIKIKL